MTIEIPEAVLKIINRINSAGYEAYIVGGCVRDYLLGRVPCDWDITTDAKPAEIKKLFTRTIDTGIEHGTVTVMEGSIGYEVTTYRIDGEYEDSRHPKNVTFTASLEEDLKRRDFTINAMAYHPEKGIVDIFGGREDLANHIIRAVGDARSRFGEDALRMMRAVRFAAQLGYTIEDETFHAIRELAPTLANISAERIQTEMVKTLVSDNPYSFKLYYETGLSAVFLPEFDVAMKTEQNHIHHMYSVGEHILHSIENIKAEKVLRLAMLFHDMAKPRMLTIDEEGVTHFHGHPDESAVMAGEIMRRLKFDNASIDAVKVYCRYHDRHIEPTQKAMRRALNSIGDKYFPDLFAVNRADVLAQSMYMREEKLAAIDELERVYEEVISKKQAFSLKDLAVCGRDLMEEGVSPGPGIGEILGRMLEDVIEEPSHNDREYLLNKYVRN